MRLAILTLGLLFTALLAAFTARDIQTNGATVPGVFGAVIAILFFVALTGALFHPPRR